MTGVFLFGFLNSKTIHGLKFGNHEAIMYLWILKIVVSQTLTFKQDENDNPTF